MPESNEILDLWQQILNRWQGDGVKLSPKAKSKDIDHFEKMYSVALPETLRSFFETVGGMEQYEMDSSMLCFWSLTAIEPVSEKWLKDTSGYDDYFIFIDWGIHIWHYALKLTKDKLQPASVYKIEAGEGELISSSFVEFMSAYAEDPDSVI